MMDFYVYCFLDPRKPGNYSYGDLHFDHEPFYVGKGSGARMDRQYDPAHTFKARKTAKILAVGLEVIRLKLNDGLDESRAFKLEAEAIRKIGRADKGMGPLTNLTDGGDGVSGWKPNENELERRRKAAAGKNNPWSKRPPRAFTGKTHTKATTDKIRSTLRAREVPSDEIQRHRAAIKRSWDNGRPCRIEISIDGVIHRSMRAASIALGIHSDVIEQRIKSGHPGYQVVQKH